MPFDCGACVAKYLLCLFNFIVFLAGSVVLGVGIWLAVDKNSFIVLMKVVDDENLKQFTEPTVIEQASYILIVAGAFMFIVSFLGYCGALRESQCLLTTYGICLVIILIMEITAGGLAAAYRGKAELETRGFLKMTIDKYYTTSEKRNAVTQVWNVMMKQLSCCGVDDSQDITESPGWKNDPKGQIIPIECCVWVNSTTVKDSNCVFSPSEANSYYKTGCYKTIINWIMQQINTVIIVAICLGIIQLLGIFLAFCLCKSIDGSFK